jgi:hypothetical protein
MLRSAPRLRPTGEPAEEDPVARLTHVLHCPGGTSAAAAGLRAEHTGADTPESRTSGPVLPDSCTLEESMAASQHELPLESSTWPAHRHTNAVKQKMHEPEHLEKLRRDTQAHQCCQMSGITEGHTSLRARTTTVRSLEAKRLQSPHCINLIALGNASIVGVVLWGVEHHNTPVSRIACLLQFKDAEYVI